jgi:hypothetical protein
MNKTVIAFGIAASICGVATLFLTGCTTQKPYGDCQYDKYGELVCVQIYARGE